VPEDLIPLVMMAEDDATIAQFAFGGVNAGFTFGVIQQGEIFKRERGSQHHGPLSLDFVRHGL
jgi:hypothetical protein